MNGVFEYRGSVEHSGGVGFGAAGDCDGVAYCCLCLLNVRGGDFVCAASNVVVA